MDWKFAGRILAKDINRAAHVVAAVVFSAAWFGNSLDAAILAASAWVSIRALGFLLDAWAGPAP
ncbi:hypothetical protein [Acidithiobacillus ferridurans]|uniref:Uncharacterized protein n=1 Tax=Acidithiobacillus ferridurans TaxID=1232575 RepID=A0A8X8KB67_ACIFI|nr:hypothetical protein [Acidithiobacillus ferridurans]MBU2715577.1 hypothetical protein [Acidithiobacillus ferridurans]MBU2722933.1 hypothetical protein [Acidithiobacillus ferridurans]MBU2728175.1 hypothetical protein [Acidithiobacillus ferridurans]